MTMSGAQQTLCESHTVGVGAQAEKQSMEQQLEALTMQLESMKAKNIETAGHNSTLEKAIAFKDYEVAKLQESNHVRPECRHLSRCDGYGCTAWHHPPWGPPLPQPTHLTSSDQVVLHMKSCLHTLAFQSHTSSLLM